MTHRRGGGELDENIRKKKLGPMQRLGRRSPQCTRRFENVLVSGMPEGSPRYLADARRAPCKSRHTAETRTALRWRKPNQIAACNPQKSPLKPRRVKKVSRGLAHICPTNRRGPAPLRLFAFSLRVANLPLSARGGPLAFFPVEAR